MYIYIYMYLFIYPVRYIVQKGVADLIPWRTHGDDGPRAPMPMLMYI